MRFFILIIVFTLVFSPFCIAKELYKAESRVNNSTNINDVLSGLEKQVYGRDYDFEDIPTRIERLENSIYGARSHGALLGRIERLKKSIIVSKNNQSNTKQQVILELLENRYFDTSYNKDKIEDRLTRLEEVILGRPFVGNIEYRFDNLIQKVPVNIVGISVTDTSGNKVSVRPELETKHYSALDDLDYMSSEGDYFGNIEKQINNKVQRWSDFPIYICVLNANDYNKTKIAQKAVEIWSKYVQLVLINNAKDAHIVINWDENGSNVTDPVKVLNGNGASHQYVIQAGYYKYSNHLDKFLMHEIGHALGILGHSDNPKDIMYNFKEIKAGKNIKSVSINSAPEEPSRRDINTLIKIYNSPGN